MAFERYHGGRLLVDLNHLAYRNWAANATLATSGGEPTGAVYGTLKSLCALSALFRPGSILAARDDGVPFRRALYPPYKAHRLDERRTEEQRDARRGFNRQLERLGEVLECLGVPVLTVPELEADDLAALAAQRLAGSKPTVLVSGDHDYVQLVRPGTALYNPTLPDRGKLLAHDGPEYATDQEESWRRRTEVGPLTFTRFVADLPRGVPLARWLDFRALSGDASDNLPGVHGIGPTAALRVVERYGSLDALRRAGPGDWTNVLHAGQIKALGEAFATGDLERQHQVIDLCLVGRTEGVQPVLDALAARIAGARPDAARARALLVRWEMSSFLVEFKAFLRHFPACR